MKFLGKHKKPKPFNRCGEITQSWFEMQNWYQTPVGRELARQEQQLVSSTLSNLFGYHLLQVGRIDEENWLASSRVSHCEVMDISTYSSTNNSGLCGLPEHLPIKSDSLDVMFLPHVLEFSQHPHTVLREVERILIPEGHVVLLVFNPFSLWKFWQWIPGKRKKVPWCGRFLSAPRIRDWFALLGFDVISTNGYFFRPAVQSASILNKLSFLDGMSARFWPFLGAANLIVAKKRVMTLTPLGRSWTRPKAGIVTPAGLAEPFQKKNRPNK